MKNRTLILVVALAVVAISLAGIALYAFNILSDWKVEEHKLREDIAQQESRSKRLLALKTAFARAKDDEIKLNEFFYQSTEEDWLRFVTTIEQLGRTSGVRTQTSATDFSPGMPFAVSVQFSGRWEDCYKFFKLLESFPARITINRFALQGDGNPADAKLDSKWIGSVSVELASIVKK